MNTYVILDSIKNGDGFADDTNTSDLHKAIEQATAYWEHMSRSDRDRRAEYAVAMPGYDVSDPDADYADPIEYIDLLPRLRAYDSGEKYYILHDLDGYGNSVPVCVTRERAEELAREWDADDPDSIWDVADIYDIAKYGIEG